jgi:hypothetical protein
MSDNHINSRQNRLSQLAFPYSRKTSQRFKTTKGQFFSSFYPSKPFKFHAVVTLPEISTPGHPYQKSIYKYN